MKKLIIDKTRRKASPINALIKRAKSEIPTALMYYVDAAKTDEDFDNIRKSKEFKELIGE